MCCLPALPLAFLVLPFGHVLKRLAGVVMQPGRSASTARPGRPPPDRPVGPTPRFLQQRMRPSAGARVSHAAELTYDLDASPPPLVAIGAGFQLVAVVGIQTLNALVIGRAAGLGPEALADLLRACFLALGIGTLLQARRAPVGSGFLCASSLSSAFLPPALLAAKSGGMALVCGMSLFSGLLLVVFSRLLHRLRGFLPVEVLGVVVVLLGLSVGLLGVRLCLDADAAARVAPHAVLVAGVSLAVMIGLKVWGAGTPALLCTLIGVIGGIALAGWLGMLPADLATGAAAERLLAMPACCRSAGASMPASVCPSRSPRWPACSPRSAAS